jgi:hypothetical protein
MFIMGDQIPVVELDLTDKDTALMVNGDSLAIVWMPDGTVRLGTAEELEDNDA